MCRRRSGVFYVRADKGAHAHCKSCNDTVSKTVGAAIGVAASFVILVLALQTCALRLATVELTVRVWSLFSALGIVRKLKLIVSFYQIATRLADVYEVQVPPEVLQLLSYFSFSISLGLDQIETPLACLHIRGHSAKLIFWMVAPAVLTLFAVLLNELVRAKCGSRVAKCETTSLRYRATPWALRILFLCYPIVTATAFQSFPCYRFGVDGEEGAWLRADVAIKCETAEHTRLMTTATVAILIYPVGAIVAVTALVFNARQAIAQRKPTPLSEAIGFLHAEYDPSWCHWEVTVE
jgi:hypothetical protein